MVRALEKQKQEEDKFWASLGYLRGSYLTDPKFDVSQKIIWRGTSLVVRLRDWGRPMLLGTLGSLEGLDSNVELRGPALLAVLGS